MGLDVAPVFPEDLSREKITAIQLERLSRLVDDSLAGNRFWSARLLEAGIDVADGDSVFRYDPVAWSRLPFTTKQDLVADQDGNPPYGTNLSEPLPSYTRLHQTSGTTGRPLRWLDTPGTWAAMLEGWQQIFRIAGLAADDRFAFPFSFGPFIGFWAAFEGAASAGHLCLSGGGMTSLQRLQLMEDNNATVLCCTPTYAMRLAEVADSSGKDLRRGAVSTLIVAGEPGGSVPGIRQQIETAWGARVIDHWGMTELGPIAVECREAPGGMHVLETECLAEVVDRESGELLSPGMEGELVITTLRRTASPVIRYRTGDLVVADPEPCACGRALLRLRGGILGRADDMITVRGNNLYPSSIESVIRRVGEVVEFRIHVTEDRQMDRLDVIVEVSETADGMEVAKRVATEIRNTFNLAADVTLAEAGSLPRFELKGRRFVVRGN